MGLADSRREWVRRGELSEGVFLICFWCALLGLASECRVHFCSNVCKGFQTYWSCLRSKLRSSENSSDVDQLCFCGQLSTFYRSFTQDIHNERLLSFWKEAFSGWIWLDRQKCRVAWASDIGSIQYCTTFLIVLALFVSSGFLSGSAFFVSCPFVYWCLPFSLVFSRLCCQLCCQLFPPGYSCVACLGFKWQAISENRIRTCDLWVMSPTS